MTHGAMNFDDYPLLLGPNDRPDLHGAAAAAYRAKRIKDEAWALADRHAALLTMGLGWLAPDYMEGGGGDGREADDN